MPVEEKPKEKRAEPKPEAGRAIGLLSCGGPVPKGRVSPLGPEAPGNSTWHAARGFGPNVRVVSVVLVSWIWIRDSSSWNNPVHNRGTRSEVGTVPRYSPGAKFGKS